jgi:cytochrome d ubiquinol oxidase subunit I
MADPLLLSRIQFAFTVTFHIIFPTMSIGLGGFLVLVEGLWLKTGDPLYLRIYRFWLVIFAMGFGVGVVTGIVLSFQFGTNWARFAQMAGPVIAPMISLEVLTSFFLEAGFLGIMLYGSGRVGKGLHFFATCMVALGSLMSAGWILAANSWMQTPDGVVFENGRFVVVSWLKAIFNPSFPYRYVHMLLAAYIAGSFIVAGVSAWYLLRGRHRDFARRSLSLALGIATVLVAGQVFLGDILAGVVARYQPAKIQAIEGNWDDRAAASYLLFIDPNVAQERNDFELGVPYLGSLLVTHTLHGTVEGVKRSAVQDRPKLVMVFYAFRVMFLIGILMFAVVCVSIWLRLHGRLHTTRWFLHTLVWLTPSGLLATVGGWYTTETGRQPWVVFGQLRTADVLSPVFASQVEASLALIVCIYTLFGCSFLVLALHRIRRGPDESASSTSPVASMPSVGVVKRVQQSPTVDAVVAGASTGQA